MKNAKHLAVTGLFFGTLVLFGLGSLFVPDRAVSDAERRPLQQFASYSEKKQNGGKNYGLTDYFSDLEGYLLDQFPGREGFRSLKAIFKRDILLQKDNNGYYYAQGHLGKLEPAIHQNALRENVQRLNQVYETYFQRGKGQVYYGIIPDKNAFLAEPNGYPHMDYADFRAQAAQGMPEGARELNLMEELSLDSYYRTDPHWSQEKLTGFADKLLKDMGSARGLDGISFRENRLPGFYGTYYGQAALPVGPDELVYLTAPELQEATAYHYAAKQERPLYVPENFTNVDPYDVFLDGAVPLVRIQNPKAAAKKQLVLFRDSYGSALAPLLAAEYEEVLVVDIRYVSPRALGTMVRFRGDADVLFLYSTTVLNTYGIFLN